MKMFQVLLSCFVLFSVVQSQSDGSFWWLNKNLMKGASVSRAINENSAKVRTLPPRYQKGEEKEKISSTTVRNSIFVDEEEEENEMFKFDNEPDCTCVPKYLCSADNLIITDGNGVIDERAYNICGQDNVCCRIPKSTTKPPTDTQRIPTTQKTPSSYLNFNLNNITNLISTILKPVSDMDFNKKPEKCVSRKGKKIEKRILINDYEDEDEGDHDEDGVLIGETSFAEFPWMLEILKKNRQTNSFEYKCGGVLINPTTGITANHCLKGASRPSNFLVRAGEWDRSSTFEFAPHHDREVSQIISHPSYYSGGLFNDVALMKWQSPLKQEVNLAPICLPDDSDFFQPGVYCTVTGWGKTSEDSQTTDKLKFVKVPLVARNTCETQFQNNRLGRRFKLHESFICAGGEEGKDSCKNDGGSPLICPRKDGSYVLAGLVSWGLDCGQKNVPGAYTNIQHLVKWINSNKDL